MNARNLSYLSLIFVLVILSGCQKPDSVHTGNDAVVHIHTSIWERLSTKSPIITETEETPFPTYDDKDDRGSYGIFVCKHGTTDKANAHKSNSYNLRARKYASWVYNYVSDLSSGVVSDVDSGTQNITLTARDDHATADLYAYAPYIQGAYSGGPRAIPYSMPTDLINQRDLMYAVENTNSMENTDLDPEGGDINVSFHFKHAYALLEFRFKVKNDQTTSPFSPATGSTFNLTDVYISRVDSDLDGSIKAKLYRSGTFDAIAGQFNDDGESTDSIHFVYNRDNRGLTISSASDPSKLYIMLVPTEVDDDEMVFTFKISGLTAAKPFSLKRSYLTHYTDETHATPIDDTEGTLEGGFTYTFDFTLDNYMHFDGFSVSDGWNTPENPLGSQEI